MNVGIYQNAASLSALERWQNVVTQNLASSEVSGFKRRTVQIGANFAGELYPDTASRPGAGEMLSAFFPKTSSSVNFQQGEIRPTDRELDMVIESDGFFSVRGADGQVLYTRAGSFQLSPERTLVTAEGFPVLSDGGDPIELQPEGGNVIVNKEGTVVQDETIIGRLGIYRFDRPGQLIPRAGGYFAASPGAAPMEIEEPGVLQERIEMSNVAPLREMVDLIAITRAYEVNAKMIQSRDDLMGKTIEAFS
ncbi:flagellar hook-basal body protein [Termitidicoccus mucosus]|uniref:Uncharacterized protein n=1 Tax=Termitidicoccus mucosus TaxID=1184151 RepID=A0A178IF72_9BACT|nr:hypothetical protein AW736_16385 [Opitutaceae bacterium TSB47]